MVLATQTLEFLEVIAGLSIDTGQLPATLPGLASLGHSIADGALMDPRFRATWAIGLLISRTIRTAPSQNARSYFFRFCNIAAPHCYIATPHW